MDFSLVQAAEEELLTSATRHNQNRLRELLHPDFVEVGRSGRRWTRDETVTALADEDDRAPTLTGEWEFVELSSDIVLVTYVIRNTNAGSRHSSVWALTEGQLQMRFHQGTRIAVHSASVNSSRTELSTMPSWAFWPSSTGASDV